MRLHMLALLAVLLLAAPALADDSSCALLSRSRSKLGSKEPAKAAIVQVQEVQPPAAAPAAPAATPAPAAPAVPSAPSGTPFVDVTDPADSCAAAVSGPVADPSSGRGRRKPELNCLGCSTLRCEWRFIFGSCSAFYGEGRYHPRYPDTCGCGAK